MFDQPEGAASPSPLTTWRERIELLGGGAAEASTPARVAAGIVAAVAVMVVAVAVLRGPPSPVEVTLPLAGGPGDPAVTSTTTAAADALVHAAGAVHDPGVYRLPANARVADLVEAAGGPLADGDLDRLNLAAPVVDGQQVYVPRLGRPCPRWPEGCPVPVPAELVLALAGLRVA